jgi:hypothetical protein
MPSEYPCGPYGLTQGDVIANLSIPGKRDLNGDGSPVDDPATTLRLSDYFQKQGLRALLLSLAAEWCLPCKNEQPTLVSMYQSYLASGQVALLEVLVQDQLGNPAPQSVADAWATTYKLPFDIGADPQQVLTPYYNPTSMPTQLVLRTRDMSIVFLHTGPVSESQFKPILDGIAAGN